MSDVVPSQQLTPSDIVDLLARPDASEIVEQRP